VNVTGEVCSGSPRPDIRLSRLAVDQAGYATSSVRKKTRGSGRMALLDRCPFGSPRCVLYWYPAYSHPSGPSREPWYVMGDSLVFPADGHPEGPSEKPWFRMVNDEAYPTEHHEAGHATVPWFTKKGSLIYPTEHHPDGASEAPWYEVR